MKDEDKDEDKAEPKTGGEFADALFEQWWKGFVADRTYTLAEKSMAREAWDTSVALTIGRCCAKLWAESRQAIKDGKTVSAQAIRYAATKLAEMP